MAIRAAPVFLQSLRNYSGKARSSNADRLGTAAVAGYWAAVVSAPLAGAFYISQSAAKDNRLAQFRPLSFRDCLPSSRLDDYAGAYMRLRR